MENSLNSQKIKIGKLDIHYRSGGQGEPLLVIHGGGNSGEAWLRNATALADYYKVYVPDLPGFGLSQPLGDKSFSEFVSFVDSFSDSLGLERFHLVGHSFGGGVALQYALESPQKVSKLILVSSLCLGQEIALWARFVSRLFLYSHLGKAMLCVLNAAKHIAKWLYAPMELVTPALQVDTGLGIARSVMTLKGQTTVLLNRLPELLMPTLLVWGSKDSVVPATHCYAASELIPDCRLHIFEGCGHNVYRERLKEFSRLVNDFLG